MSPHSDDALVPLGRPGPGRPPVRERVRARRRLHRHDGDPGGRPRGASGSPSRWPSELLDELRRRSSGAEHVLTDHETRLHRTRGKSTPDMLKLRAGDGSDSPDAVVRPGTHDEVAALIAWAVEHHVALVPFGGGTSVVGGLVARREGYAGVVSLDLIRFDKLLAVDTDSMTATLEPGPARSRGRGAARRARADPRATSRSPSSTPRSAASRSPAPRGQSSAGYGRFDSLVVGLRVATPQGELVLGNSPANAAGPDLREVVMGSEGAFGVVTAVTVRVRRVPGRQGLRDLALGLLRRRRRRDAHPRAGRRAARPCCGSPTRTRPQINLAKPAEVGGRVRWRLPDGHRLRGHPGGGRRQAHGRHRAAHRARRHLARRGRGLVVGPLPRPLPARLAARRRRARRDPRDGDVLVQPAPGVRRREGRAHRRARRGHPRALPHLARLRDRRLALLHRRREAVRRPGRRSGWRRRRPPPTR